MMEILYVLFAIVFFAYILGSIVVLSGKDARTHRIFKYLFPGNYKTQRTIAVCIVFLFGIGTLYLGTTLIEKDLPGALFAIGTGILLSIFAFIFYYSGPKEPMDKKYNQFTGARNNLFIVLLGMVGIFIFVSLLFAGYFIKNGYGIITSFKYGCGIGIIPVCLSFGLSVLIKKEILNKRHFPDGLRKG